MKLKSSLKYSGSFQKGILCKINIFIKGKKTQMRANLIGTTSAALVFFFFFIVKIMSWLIYEGSGDLFEESLLQYLC